MQLRQLSAINATSMGFAATVPTFLILSLNGTVLFYGIDTVASLSVVVGLTAFLASLFRRKRA
jgi:hypothetical protein